MLVLILVRVVQEILRSDDLDLGLALLIVVLQLAAIARLLLLVHLLVELALHLKNLIIVAMQLRTLGHEFQTIRVSCNLNISNKLSHLLSKL